jgi:glycosyltransferase involved in cell wall biosynthesis
MRPDIVINLVGWDMSSFDVPFPYVNNTALDISELNALYNRCAVALVLSLTNLSLLPMEVMASGAVPMINDADNTRDVFDSPHIEYVPLSPRAIAERIIAVLDNPQSTQHAKEIADSVAATHWDDPAESFLREFVSVMEPRG